MGPKGLISPPLLSISRTRSCRRQETRSKKVMITTRWIPKTLLKAQGYYEGKTSIWLPKHSQKQVGKPLLQAHKPLHQSLATSRLKSACTVTNLASSLIASKISTTSQCHIHKTGSIIRQAQWLLQLLQAKLAQEKVVDYFAAVSQQSWVKSAGHQPPLKLAIKDPTKSVPKLYPTLNWIPKLPQ